jgi:tetratricopeptide (TPR) repeat protein
MKKIALLILILGWVTNAHGCLNGEIYELKDGSILYEDYDERIVPHGHAFFLSEFDGVLDNLDSLWKKTKDVDYLSDYALVLALKKQYDESAKIYLQIEKMSPGRYSTASNLGTVYELMGQNEKALQWISKAVAINPQSHKNSEWIHVNILKAKIEGDDAINSEFLLDTDFGDSASPSSSLDHQELVALRDALYYQLNERVTFVDPPDKIVAALLFNLADIAWLTGEQTDAISVYDIAEKYGMDGELFKLRYNNAKTKIVVLTPASMVKKSYRALVPLVLGGIGLCAVVIFVVFVEAKQRNK